EPLPRDRYGALCRPSGAVCVPFFASPCHSAEIPLTFRRQAVMPKCANVVTIDVAPGRRDRVVTLLLAHKARLKDEPGTLQFEVLLPKDDDTKVRVYEMYRDAAAFEVHLKGPSLAQGKEETPGMVVKLQARR